MRWRHFNSFALGLGQGSFDFTSDVMRIMLVTGYTYDAAHNFRDDVTGVEISGTGYTAGGVALSSVTWAKNSSLARIDLDAADAVWSGADFSAEGAIWFRQVGGDLTTPATDDLFGYLDFEQSRSADNIEFRIRWADAGLFAIPYEP